MSFKKIAAGFGAIALSGSMALAVDLINKDGKKYDIKIHSGASTTSTSIESNTNKMGVCKECKIEVEGVGTIEAKGDEKVLIKDGKLVKE